MAVLAEKNVWWLVAEIHGGFLVGYTMSMALILLFWGSRLDSLTLTAWNNQNIIQVMASFIPILALSAPGVWLMAFVMNAREVFNDFLEIFKIIKEWWLKQ